MTPPAASVATEHPSRPTIFVQIAAYRDPQCQLTVADLFERATHPERVFVGICWQFDETEDPHEVPVSRPKQVRQVCIPVGRARGCCWARHQTQELWKDEAYTLQIDAHMRFVDGWDVKAISMVEALRERGFRKPVLSHMPPGYELDESRADWFPTGLRGKFDDHGIMAVKLLGKGRPADAPPEPTLGAFVVAGFIFAPSEVIRDVPYDPHLYFLGEEATLSARLWTHGWDIFHPNEALAYHLYKRSIPPSRKPKKHGNDHDDAALRDRFARMRVRYLLANDDSADPRALSEIHRYDLGHERTLRMYEDFSGIDFRERTIRTHSILGLFDPILAPPFDAGRFDIFFSRFERQIPYACAAPWSSSLLATRLPHLLRGLKVQRITDAGCGEASLAAQVDGLAYHGVDIIRPLIAALAQRTAHNDRQQFSCGDVTRDPLPPADLVISRDLLPRLSTASIRRFLQNLASSPTRYLLTDHCFAADPLSESEQEGVRRSLNLTKGPFYLPAPLLVIPDGPGDHGLGLWDIEEIRFFLRPMPPARARLRSLLVPPLLKDIASIQQAFCNTPELADELLSWFFLGCGANKELLSQRTEIYAGLQTPFKIPMRARNNLLKLVYVSRSMHLSENYPEVNESNETDARILTRDCIQWSLNRFRAHVPFPPII